MSLQYNCLGCGTPLGDPGLCWKCKCEQERSAALAWTPGQITERQEALVRNIRHLAEMEALDAQKLVRDREEYLEEGKASGMGLARAGGDHPAGDSR